MICYQLVVRGTLSSLEILYEKWYAVKLNKLFKICSFIFISMEMTVVETTRLSHELCILIDLPQIEFYLFSDLFHHNLFLFQKPWWSLQILHFNIVKTLLWLLIALIVKSLKRQNINTTTFHTIKQNKLWKTYLIFHFSYFFFNLSHGLFEKAISDKLYI